MASLELSGVFAASFWDRLVLQACQDQSLGFIRHGLVTIGHLNHRIKASVPRLVRGRRQDCDDSLLTAQDGFMLQQYNKFLAGSRRVPTDGIQGVRIALIVSLLIQCIESLQWHHIAAENQIRNGLRILEELWTTRELKDWKLQDCAQPISSAFPMIENEIMQEFHSLELEPSILLEPKFGTLEEKLKSQGTECLRTMPLLFKSMEEARMYSDLIIRRGQHFLKVAKSEKGQRADLQQVNSPSDLEPLYFQQEVFASENRRWMQAVEPVYHSMSPWDPSYLGFLIINSRHLMLKVLVASELSPTELIFDNFIPEFREMVELYKRFFHHPYIVNMAPEGSYSSTTGLNPLFPIATRCRDRAIRREAITLLRSRYWREGERWSVEMAEIAECLMLIEEEGIESDYVPDQARVRLLEVIDEESEGGKQVIVKYVQNLGPNGVTRTKVVYDWKMGDETEGFSHNDTDKARGIEPLVAEQVEAG